MKLTTRQRHEITRRYKSGENTRLLAQEFNVSVCTITRTANPYAKWRLKIEKAINPPRSTWSERLERLRSSGKLTQFVFKSS